MPDPIPTQPLEIVVKTGESPASTPSPQSTADPNRTSDLSSSPTSVAVPDIPGYEILGELGRGGMGVVYQARQRALNRVVALKMIRAAAGASTAEVARFVAEAEAVAAVRHINVVQVFECGKHDGLPYIALEFLPGGSLASHVKSAGRFVSDVTAEIVAKIADGVEAAHEQGIVHRDLKPANVLLDELGEPKVTDFGIARRGNSDLTATGAVVGTPHYMAPEQAAGRGKFVGPAADIYAIGVILFECLTGTVPFSGPDTWSVIRQVVTDPPPRPRSLSPAIPRDLELICLKCLAKEPHERYTSAADLAADLRCYLAGKPVTARPLGIISCVWRAVKRNPIVTGAMAAVLLSSTIGTTVALVKADEAKQSAAHAKTEEEKAKLALADKIVAEAQKEQAFKQRLEAESQQKRIAETVVYARELQTAQERLQAGDVPGAEQALAACRAELRGWEWQLMSRWLARRAPLLPKIPEEHMPHYLAVSADGRWVASAGQEGDPLGARRAGRAFVWVWDLKAGTAPVKLAGQFADVTALTFDTDSKRVAAFGDVLRVWDLAKPSKPCLECSSLPSSHTVSARFTPAGLVAVLAGANAKEEAHVVTWRKDAKPSVEVTISFPRLTSAAIGPDGTAVLLAGELPGPAPLPDSPPPRSTVRLFGIDGKPLAESVEFEASATAAAFTSNGKGTVVAITTPKPATEASLLLVRWEDRKAGARIRLGCDTVRHLEFRADGRAVIASGTINSAGEVRVWDPEGGQVTTVAKFDLSGGVGFIPDGRFVFGDYRGGPRLLLPVGPAVRSFGGSTDPLASFALLNKNRLVTTSYPVYDGSKPARLFLQSLNGGPVETIVPDVGGIDAPTVCRAGNRLAVSIGAGFDKSGSVLLLDPATKATVHRWQLPGDMMCWALASDPLGQRVAFGGPASEQRPAAERGVQLYDAVSGKLERSLPIPLDKLFPRSLAFDPKGKYLAVGLSAPYATAGPRVPEVPPGGVVVWDADTGAVVWTAEKIPRGVTNVAFSPDGSLVAACGGDRMAHVWQTADGKRLAREFPVPTSGQVENYPSARLDSIVFSPDGTRLVAINERSVILWDVATGQLVATIPLIRPSGFGQNKLEFTPDGRQLVLSDGAGNVLMFDPSTP